MAKHRKHDIEGNLFDDEPAKREALTNPEPGEGIGDSSLSPIDTF